MESNNNQLVKLDNAKMIETINSLSIPENEKQELVRQLISNDVEFVRIAKLKIAESNLAQEDIINFLGELGAMSKKGVYVGATLESKTGSGKITINSSGGDTKLIIPVLVIVGVVIIAALAIVFLK
jgi:hypothetical protein